ncbi:unnamed protein product [Symbiodinium sp. CCMP2456]|nr:unnamed protein product [Symbiodinium sp. CCMP2456]
MKLLLLASLAIWLLNPVVAKKFGKEDPRDLQLALLERAEGTLGTFDAASSNFSEEALDAVVSAKALEAVGDAFSDAGNALGGAVETAGNAIATAAVQTVDTLTEAGMTLGSAVANAAVVVGKHIVKAAETQLAALPAAIKDVAEDIGKAAVQVGSVVADVGELAAGATLHLAGDILERAKSSIQQGVKLAEKVGKFIADKAVALGGEVAKLGPLVAGLAEAAWNEIKGFLSCFSESLTLCHVLLGGQCDCNAGSHVTPSASGFSMRCVFDSSSEFASGFGIRAVPAQKFPGRTAKGTVILPGDEYVQAYKMAGQIMRSRQALKERKAKAPIGSCETGLDLAFEGAAQFAPDISISMSFNGDTEISIKGLIRASIDALVSAQGSCAFHAEKGIPRLPKSKVICGAYFCLAIMLQVVAEIDIKGVLTGTLEISADVDFEIEGTVTVNPLGEANANFRNPSIKHQDGFAIGASASSSVRVGMGPVLTVWPVPGIPINFHAMINAEAKAMGTLSFSSGMFLLQEESHHSTGTDMNASSTRSNEIGMCGAAAVSTYADVDITSFALPSSFRAAISTSFLMEQITAAVIAGATAMTRLVTGAMACIPGGDAVENTIMSAASSAASAIAGLIPDLDLDFSVESIQLMAPQKLWCQEVFKTPGFDAAPCAAEIGCKFAGRPPPRGVEMAPPEQVTNHVESDGAAAACHDIPMGDRFIQLGRFRLADIDGNHFSISYEKDGQRQTAQIFRNDGTLHGGPRSDYSSWTREIGASKGIHFGFQYIQIGNFRLGAYDDTHLTISHIDGKTAQIFRNDGELFPGPRDDFSTFDRAEGVPAGISFGDRFIQFGKFRIGDADGENLVVTHTDTPVIQIYRHDGTRHKNLLQVTKPWKKFKMNKNFKSLRRAMNNLGNKVKERSPAAWTCKDIAEMAFGVCDPDFGAWGDRFIQLGQWRLAAIDDTHFSISHKDGNTAQIYRSDGSLHPGPRTDYGAWHRALGFPFGITFGPGFIQIGKFRLGAVNDEHFSISHRDGNTIQIFRDDGTRHAGPRQDWSLWGITAGPASGITFGDRFLQLGKFRIGDVDGTHFVVTHLKTGNLLQLYKNTGTLHPHAPADWARKLNSRYAQFHCGGIQTILGTCPGITTGDRFMQLGDWRLAAMDSSHFSISHRNGQTAMIYKSDGTRHAGPREDWGGWDREAKKVTKPGASLLQWNRRRPRLPSLRQLQHEKIKFGDRFIQFGEFRIGEADESHFSISHKGGQTIQIFRSDGTLHPGPRTDYGLWDRDTGAAQGVTFGDRFVQIGNFRIGDVDSGHFSVSHVDGETIQIFRSDGNHFDGPRTDWTTFGRQLLDCTVE